MALRIGELPFSIQLLICVVVLVGVVAAGEFLAFSPVKAAQDDLDAKTKQQQTLTSEVAELEAVKQQYAEFQAREEALKKELANLALLVPNQKQTDEFIRLLQSSAKGAQIAIRRLTAKSVVLRDFYAEMPFEIELDGPYYNLVDFYRRLGNTTRIINAAGLKLGGLDPTKGKFDYDPSTTVGGTCATTTYYKPSDAELEAAAPPKAPARGGRAQPPARGAAPRAAPAPPR
jgi:type IV pilus assembly protein PilO